MRLKGLGRDYIVMTWQFSFYLSLGRIPGAVACNSEMPVRNLQGKSSTIRCFKMRQPPYFQGKPALTVCLV